MDATKYNDLVIDGILIREGVLKIHWRGKIGFGELTFRLVNGKLEAETETLGKDFMKAVLEKFADTAIIVE